jgi:hypothetical protein
VHCNSLAFAAITGWGHGCRIWADHVTDVAVLLSFRSSSLLRPPTQAMRCAMFPNCFTLSRLLAIRSGTAWVITF